MKKRTGIFGAGQAGAAAASWLPDTQQLICFIDNNEQRQQQKFQGIAVCSPAEAMEKRLDVIWTAVLNREAGEAIERQLKELGFEGEIISVQRFRQQQDIRLALLRMAAAEIRDRNVPGAIAELGVYQGDFAAEMNRLFRERTLYLFDTFCGFDSRDLEMENANGNRFVQEGKFSDTSVELVEKKLPYPEQAVFCRGHFPESTQLITEKLSGFALVSIDPDLYEPVYQGLKFFYPLLSPGGMLLIHDYNSMQYPGVKKAVRRYCTEQNLYVVPMTDLHGSAVLIRQG